MDLKKLSADELVTEARNRVASERQSMLALLECLREIDSRRLYLDSGFPSLWEFCVKELGLSEGAAHRRIAAARMIEQIPEVKPAIEEGRLQLSTIAMAQTVFRKKKCSVPEKRQILKDLENTSKREAETQLAQLLPEAPKLEQVRVVSEENVELRLTVSKEMMDKLEKLKSLLAHSHPEASWAELLEHAVDLALKKVDPEQKPASSPPPGKVTVHQNPRYIPAWLKKLVWKRAQGCCEFVSPKTGRRCGSRYRSQVDHRIPLVLGGRTEEANLRLLCASHNASEAARILGTAFMNRYRTGPSKNNRLF